MSREAGTGVVFLQQIAGAKLERAREMRKCMTRAEAALWEQLRGRRLAGLKFRRQQIIKGFIVDFFCHELKLVVEVDGEIHSTGEQQEIDKHRRAVFEERGLHEIRFSNDDVLDRMPFVLEAIGNFKNKNRAEVGNDRKVAVSFNEEA